MADRYLEKPLPGILLIVSAANPVLLQNLRQVSNISTRLKIRRFTHYWQIMGTVPNLQMGGEHSHRICVERTLPQ
ncbi:MAG: hypothetical protein CM1200mP30_10730 [Pseudomonadota bacterium]|nr:MAG: hypothetical protein CM1200mP30_10730 [Pseudomonadota bacterium]